MLTRIGRSTFFLVSFRRDDVAALIVSILSSVLILFQSAGQSRIGTAPQKSYKGANEEEPTELGNSWT